MNADYSVLIRALREAFGDRLKTVVLFGSRARGEAGAGSDPDVLVVIDDLSREPVSRQMELRGALRDFLADLPGAVGLVQQLRLPGNELQTPWVPPQSLADPAESRNRSTLPAALSVLPTRLSNLQRPPAVL